MTKSASDDHPYGRLRTTLVTLAMIAAVLALLPLVLSQQSIF